MDIDNEDYNQVELRLNALEKKLKSIYGQTLFGIHTLDVNGKFLSINDIELAWLGYSSQEVIGKLNFIDLLTTDSRQRYMTYLEKQFKSGVVEDIDLALITKHDSIKNITLYSTPVLDSDGKFIKHQSVLFNIDERKYMEQQLNIAAATFESQHGIMITDANSIIIQVNRAFSAITGYSAEEVVGLSPRLLSSGMQNKEFYQTMWKSIINTGSWQGEILNRYKDGEVYHQHLIITAVKDATGKTTNYVAAMTDITSSKAAAEKIQNLAFYDTLTRLPNRRLFLDRLQHALATSSRNSQRGALLFLDIDNFKDINDSLGHDVGDILLQQVAERLGTCVCEGDTIARLGGDEFVVLIENLSQEVIEAAKQTETICNTILTAFNHPFRLGSQEYRSTISIGATLYNDHDTNFESLLKQADIAMYEAKASGRNTLRFFDLKMQDTMSARIQLESDIRKAIELRQFQMYYQIQVGSSGRALGAEALIRWIHPERGIIEPSNFIPIAEETGLIIPIGQWVLDSACAQLKAWENSTLTKDLTIAINVSAKQFKHVNFVNEVENIIKNRGINPARLKLELTESILVINITDIIAKMTTLSKIGIRFSLDDFGTGYSSLQYLKQLPLDQLKIDQSFVRDIVTDPSDRVIVRTIISMAHNLDINVIAEGVETAEQQQFLIDNGCALYQGYLFGKPLPIEEFENSLNKQFFCD